MSSTFNQALDFGEMVMDRDPQGFASFVASKAKHRLLTEEDLETLHLEWNNLPKLGT